MRDYRFLLQSGRANQTRLKTELSDYWAQRENLAAMLGFIGRLRIPHWLSDAAAAKLLAGALENDHI